MCNNSCEPQTFLTFLSAPSFLDGYSCHIWNFITFFGGKNINLQTFERPTDWSQQLLYIAPVYFMQKIRNNSRQFLPYRNQYFISKYGIMRTRYSYRAKICWNSNSRLVSHKILPFMEHKVPFPCSQERAIAPIPSQLKPILTVTYFFKISFNIFDSVLQVNKRSCPLLN